MDETRVAEQLKQDLAPLAADQGAMVEDVVFDTKVNPPTLAITVVRADATESLSSDQVANLARVFSKHLDDNDPIEGQYTLEVSTPGVEGAIVTEAQWKRAVAKMVRVRRSNGDRVEGRLLEVTPDGVELGHQDRTEFIPFAEIKSARGVAELPKEA